MAGAAWTGRTGPHPSTSSAGSPCATFSRLSSMSALRTKARNISGSQPGFLVSAVAGKQTCPCDFPINLSRQLSIAQPRQQGGPRGTFALMSASGVHFARDIGDAGGRQPAHPFSITARPAGGCALSSPVAIATFFPGLVSGHKQDSQQFPEREHLNAGLVFAARRRTFNQQHGMKHSEMRGGGELSRFPFPFRLFTKRDGQISCRRIVSLVLQRLMNSRLIFEDLFLYRVGFLIPQIKHSEICVEVE